MSDNDLIRPVEEKFLRNAIIAFPYKQSLVHAAIAREIPRIEFGQPPSAYIVLCQALLVPDLWKLPHSALPVASPRLRKVSLLLREMPAL
uniref:Uncharacterized protein n=1 Tax=Ditylenchus dipsaci TaxID=166011 RepID=A0A915EPM2_9BILA